MLQLAMVKVLEISATVADGEPKERALIELFELFTYLAQLEESLNNPIRPC